MQPVLETRTPDGFDLWPVADIESFSLLPLSGELTPAERVGDTVRLTVDTERSDSPVIELPVTELRHLLDGAEGDLADFLALAADWAARSMPDRSARVTAALTRALSMPGQETGVRK